jgi:hypothetical protein
MAVSVNERTRAAGGPSRTHCCTLRSRQVSATQATRSSVVALALPESGARVSTSERASPAAAPVTMAAAAVYLLSAGLFGSRARMACSTRRRRGRSRERSQRQICAVCWRLPSRSRGSCAVEAQRTLRRAVRPCELVHEPGWEQARGKHALEQAADDSSEAVHGAELRRLAEAQRGRVCQATLHCTLALASAMPPKTEHSDMSDLFRSSGSAAVCRAHGGDVRAPTARQRHLGACTPAAASVRRSRGLRGGAHERSERPTYTHAVAYLWPPQHPSAGWQRWT